MLKAPTPIQLLAPPRTIPIPGMRTIISKTKHRIKMIFEYFFHVVYGINIKKIIAAMPAPANKSCLFK